MGLAPEDGLEVWARYRCDWIRQFRYLRFPEIIEGDGVFLLRKIGVQFCEDFDKWARIVLRNLPVPEEDASSAAIA